MFNLLLALKRTQARNINIKKSQQDGLAQQTALWVSHSISTFEYLMVLNSLSSRHFRDLSQYPVFPWVLRDYSADSLDLSDPGVYRDLSLPVGALGSG